MSINSRGPAPAYAYRVLIVLPALLLLAAVLGPAIQQPADYNHWVDERTIFGIPHFGDVVSNLAFLWVGALGLWSLGGDRCRCDLPGERLAWTLAFTGITLTAFGSAYYHWEPNNFRLVWDRLPMVLGFMALTSTVVMERINPKLGLRLLPFLIGYGWASIGYWYWTYTVGADDLGLYLLVQVGPVLLIPLILWWFPAMYDRGRDYLIALGIYLLAVVAEHLDAFIFEVTGFISGHNLKHLLAAFAVYWLLRMLRLRQSLSTT